MASEYVSIWQGSLQMAFSFIVTKGFSQAGRELHHFKWFLVGTMGAIVSEVPTQANNIIKLQYR